MVDKYDQKGNGNRGSCELGWYAGHIWPQKITYYRDYPPYTWLEKLLKHNRNACQISVYVWRNDERAE